MSDEPNSAAARHVRYVVGVAGLLWTVSANGLDFLAPFEDPLQTLPPVIETGVLLPGDDAPVPCPATKDFSTPLTLAEAVDIALCNNPQIKATWATIKVQASTLGEARAAYLPTLSASINRLRTRTVYTDLTGQNTDILGNSIASTFSWRLFDFGGREANREAANNLLVAAIASHDATLQKSLSAVVQAYFDAQSAQASVRAKEQNEKIAESTLAAARRREARGLGSRGDTLQAATASAKASLERGKATGINQRALATLVYTLGVSPRKKIVLADDLRDAKEIEVMRLHDWLRVAAEMHPSIKAARAQWEAARYRITATRSEGLPTVDFSAAFNENGYPSQGLSSNKSQITTVGFSLTIPIFDGFSRTYKIRGAEATAEQRRAELDDTENTILSEVVKAHADTVASVINLQAAENLLGAAKESLDTTRRRFEKGAADITEILNTQTALLDAEQEHIRGLAEWRSARLRLLAGAGMLGRASTLPASRSGID